MKLKLKYKGKEYLLNKISGIFTIIMIALLADKEPIKIWGNFPIINWCKANNYNFKDVTIITGEWFGTNYMVLYVKKKVILYTKM